MHVIFTYRLKKLAEQCCFTNPADFTGQRKRLEGVSSLVHMKEHIPLVESTGGSRYRSDDARLSYAEPYKEAYSKQNHMMMSKNLTSNDSIA